MNISRTNVLMATVACMALLAVGGCASSGASARPSEPGRPVLDLSEYRQLCVQVTRADGVKVTDDDLERIAGRIVEAIRKKQVDRFQEINTARPNPAVSCLDVRVQLTRYDKGSAFARAMLAGLGQIHVDARVVLRDRARETPLGEYDVKKTFAWGGIYGAATKIEDVEVGFAEGVATLLLDRKAP